MNRDGFSIVRLLFLLLLLTASSADAQTLRSGSVRGGARAAAPVAGPSIQAAPAPQPQPTLTAPLPHIAPSFQQRSTLQYPTPERPGVNVPARSMQPAPAPQRRGVPQPHIESRARPPHREHFPKSRGVVFYGIPVIGGTTVITQVAPGVLREERRSAGEAPAEAGNREPPSLAPFDPTPQEVVDRLLALAAVKRGDVIYDLGAGDGRILVTAARKYGARGVGFELDPGLVKLARENVRAAGVQRLVEIREQNFLSADVSRATVVTLYLSYDGNLAVREQLLRRLRPGTRVVSYTFDMGDWPPKIAESYRDAGGNVHELYLWEITAGSVARQGSEPMLQPHPIRSGGPLIIEVR